MQNLILSDNEEEIVAIDSVNIQETFVTYGTADEFETNLDIIRAEAMAMATPATSKFSDEIYSSLKNVESSCASDYKVLCANFKNSSPDTDLSLKKRLLRDDNKRELLSEVVSSFKNNDGSKLLTSVNELILNRFGAAGVKIDSMKILSSKAAAPEAKTRRALWGRHDHDEGGDSSGSDSDSEDGPKKSKPTPKGSPKSKPCPKHGHDQVPGSDSHGEMPHDGALRGPPPPPPGPEGPPPPCPEGPPPPPGPECPPPPFPPCDTPEDVYFAGALGYGAQGDMCMLIKFENLSEQCQTAIGSFYDSRDEFWQVSQAPPSPPHHRAHHTILPLIILGLVGLGIRRVFFGKCAAKRKQVCKVLEAIRANPSLKAAVEAEAGVEVPEAPRCNGKKCCMGIARFFANLLIAFFIAISSLVIATNIVMNLTRYDAKTGEVRPPSAFLALLVLFSVTLAELAAYRLILNGCRKLNNNGVQPQPTDTSAVSAAPGSPAGRSRFAVAYSNILVPLQSSFNFFGNRRNSPGYSPLVAADDTEQEMVSVHNSNNRSVVPVYIQPYAEYNGVPSNNGGVHATIVSANPMTTVRMI